MARCKHRDRITKGVKGIQRAHTGLLTRAITVMSELDFGVTVTSLRDMCCCQGGRLTTAINWLERNNIVIKKSREGVNTYKINPDFVALKAQKRNSKNIGKQQ